MQTYENMIVNQEDIQSELLLNKGDIHLYERIGESQINLCERWVGITTERHEGAMYFHPQKGLERLV